jgi:hypothetical protein
MKRTLVALVLSLGILVCVRGVAQSIRPDGRVLPAYSGHAATPPPATPPAATVVNAPASATTPPIDKSTVANAPTCPTVNGAYYLQSNGWVRWTLAIPSVSKQQTSRDLHSAMAPPKRKSKPSFETRIRHIS